MKFGKGFKTRLERRDKFLCYKQLHQPSTPAVVGRPTAVDDSGGGGGGAESRHLVDLQLQEWFVGILKEELEKFNDFYADKEEDFVIRLQVSSSNGKGHHVEEHVDSGHFAFVASDSGVHTTCFATPDHKPETVVTIEFDWKSGVAAKDWSKVAKKGRIEVMELELKKLYDTVTSIYDEIFYLREREEEMQNLNTSTNSKMAGLSFLSLLVCLSVAGLQLWHLKAYFERKKLL